MMIVTMQRPRKTLGGGPLEAITRSRMAGLNQHQNTTNPKKPTIQRESIASSGSVLGRTTKLTGGECVKLNHSGSKRPSRQFDDEKFEPDELRVLCGRDAILATLGDGMATAISKPATRVFRSAGCSRAKVSRILTSSYSGIVHWNLEQPSLAIFVSVGGLFETLQRHRREG